MKLLLINGADANSRDLNGKSILQTAREKVWDLYGEEKAWEDKGEEEHQLIQILLDNGAVE